MEPTRRWTRKKSATSSPDWWARSSLARSLFTSTRPASQTPTFSLAWRKSSTPLRPSKTAIPPHCFAPLFVLNKIDLAHVAGGPERIEISAKTGEGIEALVALLQASAAGLAAASAASPLLTRARHRVELEAALAALLRFGDPLLSAELKAEELRIAARHLGRAVLIHERDDAAEAAEHRAGSTDVRVANAHWDKTEHADFGDWCHLLFDQAVLAEGGAREDPASFVKRTNALLLAR